MKNFEKEIIVELLGNSKSELIPLLEKEFNEAIEYTGVGYFLTIKHADFPVQHSILTDPNISGDLGGVSVGYLVILLNSELTLECHSYGDEVLPEHRDLGFARKKT